MANIGKWVSEQTNTVGTGDLIVTGAQQGSAPISSEFINESAYYSILNGSNRELGIGVFDGVSRLTRSTVTATYFNGVYNDKNPTPIPLVGTSIVSCTHEAGAFIVQVGMVSGYSPTDALGNIKRVDGAGSGLDADLVKGEDVVSTKVDRLTGTLNLISKLITATTIGSTSYNNRIYILEATTISIYDATNANLPLIKTITGITAASSILAISGMLYVTSTAAGLYAYNITDNYSVVSMPAIVSLVANKIVGAVLPTAPIDSTTGLPIPIVYVATDSGVSRIAEDGSVSNWTDLGGNVNVVKSVAISDGYVYWSTFSNADDVFILAQAINTTLVDTTYTVKVFSALSADMWGTTTSPISYNGMNSLINRAAVDAIYNNRSLTIIKPNPSLWGNGLHATITSSFNSGYQFGDIRGCWLADTVAGNLVGNGTLEVADRSYNNGGLLVNGTITRTPVATGSELMGFGNFSNLNFLSRAHDPRFDIGTGDFHLKIWFSNKDSTVNDRRMINYWQSDLGNVTNKIDVFKIGASSSIAVTVGGIQLLVPISLTDTSFRRLDVRRVSGVLYAYLDGVLQGSIACTVSVGNALFSLYVGQLASLSQPWRGWLALFNFEADAITEEQIKESTNEEKKLFQPNTACTLLGTSSDVKSVDYDASTGLRHTATTTDYSVFNGLVRVGGEAGKVYTSLSANDGLVIKGN